MSKLGWLGFLVLVANAILAGWMAWRRYALAGELDSTTQGTIVSAHDGSGRTPADRLVASFVVDGKTYSASGSSNDDSSLNTKKHPLDSKITVYYNAKNPSQAALTPRAGYLSFVVLAGLLAIASVAFFLFFKKS
jgi:hypothetical protein